MKIKKIYPSSRKPLHLMAGMKARFPGAFATGFQPENQRKPRALSPRRLHFVGIKGVGMVSLAIYCKERGFTVLGSDIAVTFHTDKILKDYKIPVFNCFAKEHIDKTIDLVVYSGAYDTTTNIETKEAQVINVPLLSHGEALGKFMKGKKGISVAGTHGKTTTTAMLATIFSQAGFDPSYIIGCAGVTTLPAPGHFGQGDFFIAEADEYQTALNHDKKSRFLWQNPQSAIITNIEYDHPDVFENIDQVVESFSKFAEKIPQNGLLVYNGDDQNLSVVAKHTKCKLVRFGENRKNDYSIGNISYCLKDIQVVVNTPLKSSLLRLQIPGKHNALNACAAYALAQTLGLKEKDIIHGLAVFQGTKRRFEKIREKGGILYFDDYAHHPTEIQMTLASVKSRYPQKRIIVIFQPHTFSRTQAFLEEFSRSFSDANIVGILDIFSSARENEESFRINGKKFADSINKHHKEVYYAHKIPQMIQYLNQKVRKGDIVITMGAGDVYKLHELLK